MLIKNSKITVRNTRSLVAVLIVLFATVGSNAQRGSSVRVNPTTPSGGGDGIMNGILTFFGVVIGLALAIFVVTMVWGAINWAIGCMRRMSYPFVLLIVGAGVGAGWASWSMFEWNTGWTLLVAGVTVLLATSFITRLPRYRHLRY